MTDEKEFRKYAVHHMGMSGLSVDEYMRAANRPSAMTRTVIEERPMPFREVDVFSRLMMDRIIFLGLPVDDFVANVIQAQLLFLESADSGKDIQIYINSPGGSVYAGLGHIRYNAVYRLRCGNHLHRNGSFNGSRYSYVLGKKDKRTALRHARVMIHQPMGGVGGQASDIEITAAEIKKLKDELYAIIASHTGQEPEKVWADSDRDYWMRADEAKAYGMIDEVLVRKVD